MKEETPLDLIVDTKEKYWYQLSSNSKQGPFNDLTELCEHLGYNIKVVKTYTGSVIARSKYGVGKSIGGAIYVHKNYANQVVPPDIWKKAQELVPDEFKYNTIVYDPKKGLIRFDEAPDFDTAREPVPGWTLTVDYANYTAGKPKKYDSIWHHKWLFVKDDYKGFNVKESKNWSKLWTSKLKETAIGRADIWKKQLKEYGLE